MKHVAIYIPGIRDDLYRVQSLLIQSWRLFGVRPIMHEIPWAGAEHFEPKLTRLLNRIDKLKAKGYVVSLVGASAGATAALEAYARRPDAISSVVFICGKLRSPQQVSQLTFRHNPAFQEALQILPATLDNLTSKDTDKLFSLYSPADQIVPHADTVIPGATEHTLKPRSHTKAIVRTVSLDAAVWLRFLKAQAKAQR